MIGKISPETTETVPSKGRSLFMLLASGAASSFLVRATGMGIVFGLQVFLARVMGVDQYGIYIYVLTWMTVLLLVVTHGWDTTTIRYVSSYSANEGWNLLRGFLFKCHIRPFVTGLAVGSIVVITALLIRQYIDYELFLVLMVGSLVLPFNALLQVESAAIQGMKRVVLAQLPQQVIRPLLLFGVIAIPLFVFDITPNAVFVMTMNVASAAAVMLIAFLFLRSSIPHEVLSVSPEYRDKEWMGVALPLLLVSGFIMLMNRLDILMLGVLTNTTDAGIYSAASRIAELASSGMVAVNVIMAPLIANLYATGKYVELQRLVSQAALGAIAIAIPAGAILLFYGKEILRLFGSDFEDGFAPLVVLVVGHLMNALVGSVGFLMTMTGQQHAAAYILGISALMNAVLNILLIPVYGMLGAACATAVTMALWNAAMATVVRKRLGIFPTIFAAWRAFR